MTWELCCRGICKSLLWYEGQKWNYNITKFPSILNCDGKILSVMGPSLWHTYRKVSDIRRTLVGNKIVDHSDAVGASPVGAAPTTSSFTTWHLASMDWAKTTAIRDEKHLCLGIRASYIRDLTVFSMCALSKQWILRLSYSYKAIYQVNVLIKLLKTN